MKLGPIIQQAQNRIRFHGRAMAHWKREGYPVLAAIENTNRMVAIVGLTRVLRMAEQEATEAVEAIRKTHLDYLPF